MKERYVYDPLGRLSQRLECYDADDQRKDIPVAGWIKQAETYEYDADGRVLRQYSYGRPVVIGMGRAIERAPVLKYGLVAMDVAPGPAMYLARHSDCPLKKFRFLSFRLEGFLTMGPKRRFPSGSRGVYVRPIFLQAIYRYG